jgi:hypothetical protein
MIAEALVSGKALLVGLSFRGVSKRRTRNFEIPSLVLRTIPE